MLLFNQIVGQGGISFKLLNYTQQKSSGHLGFQIISVLTRNITAFSVIYRCLENQFEKTRLIQN